MQTRHLQNVHIAGWGKYIPAHILPNDEIELSLQLESNWIFPRTGIRERRIAAADESATGLAVEAAHRALIVAGIAPQDIDFVIVATSSPEYIMPSTASLVQHALGATHAGAADVSAACSGFVYALDLAACKIQTGSIQTALVIGAETMSRVMNWTDRKTCVLFGDGAGAVVLRGSDQPGGILSSLLRSDGSGGHLLTIPTVGRAHLCNGQLHKMTMDGRAVRDFAVRALSDGITEALHAADLTLDDLDLLIPHQANQRILEAAAEALNFPMDKIYSNLDRFGNTSAASIPIALAEVAGAGRLQRGDIVGLVGFGGGLTWGAAVVEWTG